MTNQNAKRNRSCCILVLCRRPIDGCHCERSEAIRLWRIATPAFGGLAMTTPQIKSDIALGSNLDIYILTFVFSLVSQKELL